MFEITYLKLNLFSVTELGTKRHPFKELDSALVEVLNLHSNSNRVINVHLMEDTTSYMMIGTYIVNVTQVNFKAYSTSSSVAKMAKIVTIEEDDIAVPPSMPTKFSILGIS